MHRRHWGVAAYGLVVAMCCSPLMDADARQGPAESAVVGGKTQIDLRFITPDTTAVAIVYPRRILTAPGAEAFPREFVAAAGRKLLGIDPMEIEQVLAVAEMPKGASSSDWPRVAIILRMARSIRGGRVLEPLWERTVESQLDGKSYRRGVGSKDLSILRHDNHTLIVASDGLLRDIVNNYANPKDGRMATLLRRISTPPDATAVVLVDSVRPAIMKLLAAVQPFPRCGDVARILALTTSAVVNVNLTGEMVMSLTLKARDETAAEQLEAITSELLDGVRRSASAQSAIQPPGDDPVERALGQYRSRMYDRLLRSIQPIREKRLLMFAIDGAGKDTQAVQGAMIGVATSLLISAVQKGEDAARRERPADKMSQILRAMHEHAARYHLLPARANFAAQGKPLLSWRVHLLPLLGEESLYRQFRQDEPWDSEHNRKLIPMMPRVFGNPGAPAKPGMTHYLAVCGKGFAFDGMKGRGFGAFRDGTSDTILIVEANDDRAVIWTKPDDWQCDVKDPTAGLGTARAGGFNAGFADGSVQFISNDVNARVFYAMLTIAGGELSPRVNTRLTSNMGQIGSAIRYYATAHHRFPPAYKTDKKGKPTLSWRVLILPFVSFGEGEDGSGLYRQFHLDEPWDSEHNKRLIAKMPACYRSSRSKGLAQGKTNYLGVRGQNAMLSGKEGVTFRDVVDGLSNTILMVEVPDEKAVVWTKPDDFEYDKDNPIKGLVNEQLNGFFAGLADCSIRFIASSIDPAVLRAAFTYNGKELIVLPPPPGSRY
jgi:hypothetical protein